MNPQVCGVRHHLLLERLRITPQEAVRPLESKRAGSLFNQVPAAVQQFLAEFRPQRVGLFEKSIERFGAVAAHRLRLGLRRLALCRILRLCLQRLVLCGLRELRLRRLVLCRRRRLRLRGPILRRNRRQDRRCSQYARHRRQREHFRPFHNRTRTVRISRQWTAAGAPGPRGSRSAAGLRRYPPPPWSRQCVRRGCSRS